MARNTKVTEFTEIAVNVIGFFDEEEVAWTALALEMDLRAYGKSFDEALSELVDLIRMQISFAISKGQPDMILRPADPKWFELFAQIRQERLASISQKRESVYEIRNVPVPAPHVISKLSKNFQLANA